MKNFLSLVLCGLFGVKSLLSCSICGAILPGYIVVSDEKSWISMGYRQDGFLTYYRNPQPGGLTSGMQMRHMDIQMKYMVRKKVEIIAFLPYQWVRVTSGNLITGSYSGLCDVALTARRVWVRSARSSVKRFALGGGVELPTGKRNAAVDQLLMQPGSGTYDVFLSSTAGFRNRRFGVSSFAQYKYNGTSALRVHPSNTMDIGLEAFADKAIGSHVLLQPKISAFAQVTGKAKQDGNVDPVLSDRYLAGAGAGINVAYRKLFLTTLVRMPIAQTRVDGGNAYRSGLNISAFYMF